MMEQFDDPWSTYMYNNSRCNFKHGTSIKSIIIVVMTNRWLMHNKTLKYYGNYSTMHYMLCICNKIVKNVHCG